MYETPVMAATDPLGFSVPVNSAEPAPDRESMEARRRLSFGKMIARIAAVLVPILVVGGVALWLTGRQEPAMVEISAPLGETLTIELPDGSVIEAEPGAVIAYDKSNFAANRLVSLSGEAMFDVAEVRDVNGVQIPFAVAAGSLTVNVLGTVFELSSGGESVEAAKVSLFEGSVEVTVENDPMAQAVEEHKLDTVLAVGERITVNTLTGEHATELIPATEMALHGFVPLLKFDEATLGDLVTALEMNHGVKFNLAGGIDPTEGSYSGNFEGLSLDETLEMLSKIDVALSFERSGGGGVDVKHK
jgi:ferric-dicitrate binding protein FerR (iron transport regulator)